MITIAEVRLRGIALPTDDGAAQDIVDEQEAWLAARIGPLDGERTETFWVGVGATDGPLHLARYTDGVDVEDGGSAVDPATIRLLDNGSAFRLRYPHGWRAWTGPYVDATYTPTDELLVRSALFALVGLAADPAAVGPFQSEKMGDYSYTKATTGEITPAQRRAAIVAGILPRRPQLTTLRFGHLNEPHAVRL